jgi:hypothetical protein
MNLLLKKILFVLAIALFFSSDLKAQLYIDWQQCYGGLEFDEPAGFATTNDGFIIEGWSDLGSGMISCGTQGINGTWTIRIDENLNIVNQECNQDCRYHGIFNAKDNDNEYYYFGKKGFPATGNAGLAIMRGDGELNVIWERLLGCEDHFLPYSLSGVATDDGGIVCTAIHGEWACGDVSQYYGSSDIWVVKLDKNGNLEWETTIGTDGSEGDATIATAKDGGLYIVCDADNQFVSGSIESCVHSGGYVDGILVKMNANGEVEWNRCYGGNKNDSFSNVIELPDGYLLGGISSSSDGDLQGAGYHPGHWYGQPHMPLTSDIWLLRTDLDGNVLWSKCYGGTKDEQIVKVFLNEDGGFTVFGTTMSLDGDSQSANNLKPAWNLEIGNKLWVFRTDSNGNLLWERAIGTQTESHEYLEDVIKHSDREYTILGQADSSGGEMPCGDYDCTNDTAYLMNSYSNYWVLHVTDTVDYTTLQVLEQLLPHEKTVQVYPNPCNSTVRIVLPKKASIEKVQIYNAIGQLVNTGKGENEINVKDLAEGVYLLRITDEKGINYTERIIITR